MIGISSRTPKDHLCFRVTAKTKLTSSDLMALESCLGEGYKFAPFSLYACLVLGQWRPS
jgi:hypothetical protein